jgi:hypothetical protein
MKKKAAPAPPALDDDREPEPHWPGLVAILAVGGLNLALPSNLSPGPDWLVLVLVILLYIPAMILHGARQYAVAHLMAYGALGVATVTMIVSLGLLIHGLITHQQEAGRMLLSATILWSSNVLIFASWYWRLDAGGPHARYMHGAHTDGAFLFPQMSVDPELRRDMGDERWKPGFIDYLFLAFNTSTAFSPTDVPVLSRWAKVLMMLQASISLATLALLAARAVNIL